MGRGQPPEPLHGKGAYSVSVSTSHDSGHERPSSGEMERRNGARPRVQGLYARTSSPETAMRATSSPALLLGRLVRCAGLHVRPPSCDEAANHAASHHPPRETVS
jgi:hypothetical protein